MRYLITALLVWLFVSPVSARKRPFYDEKSDIVGCVGDYSYIKDNKKFYTFNIPLPRPEDLVPEKLLDLWNEQNVGKMVLDSLLCYDGKSLKEDLLKELAWRMCKKPMWNVLK